MSPWSHGKMAFFVCPCIRDPSNNFYSSSFIFSARVCLFIILVPNQIAQKVNLLDIHLFQTNLLSHLSLQFANLSVVFFLFSSNWFFFSGLSLSADFHYCSCFFHHFTQSNLLSVLQTSVSVTLPTPLSTYRFSRSQVRVRVVMY